MVIDDFRAHCAEHRFAEARRPSAAKHKTFALCAGVLVAFVVGLLLL
jgi:hypothetical protein